MPFVSECIVCEEVCRCFSSLQCSAEHFDGHYPTLNFSPAYNDFIAAREFVKTEQIRWRIPNLIRSQKGVRATTEGVVKATTKYSENSELSKKSKAIYDSYCTIGD